MKKKKFVIPSSKYLGILVDSEEPYIGEEATKAVYTASRPTNRDAVFPQACEPLQEICTQSSH